MNTMTFEDFFYHVYLPHCMSQNHKTIRVKKMLASHYILPVMGDVSLEQITIDHLVQIHDAFQEMGYGPEYEYEISQLVNSALSLAVSNGLISENPYYPVYESREPTYPYVRRQPDQPVWYSPKELKSLIRETQQSPYRFIYQLCFATGIRSKEIYALTPDDFDPTAKTLHIHRESIRSWGEDSVASRSIREIPPGRPSNRTLPLSSVAMDAMHGLIRQYEEITKMHGEKKNPKHCLLLDSDGTPLEMFRIRLSDKEIRRKTHLSKFNFTAMRTNFIVTCFRLGWDPSSIMHYAGMGGPDKLMPYKIAAEQAAHLFSDMNDQEEEAAS